MIKAIRLEKFMAFADTGWIELRPITLLFGRNSSGKSAIIRALRLLRQNILKPTEDRYTLRFNDEYGVMLGDYKETVHLKDTEKVIRFYFQCDIPQAADKVRQVINQWRQQNNLPAITATKDDRLTLSLAFGYDPHREAELVGIDLGCAWQITTEPGSHTLLSAIRLDQETRYEVGYDWWLSTDLPAWQELDWQWATFTFPQNFLPQLEDEPTTIISEALDSVGQAVAAFLEGIEYQPPIRPEPQRFYLLDEVTCHAWQSQGWAAFIDFLAGNQLGTPTADKIDAWLKNLDLGLEIPHPVQYASKETTVSSITIQEHEDKPPINLKNTGYGASQVIPIIIQSVTARQRVKENTPVSVIIEQPELHLHPRAQAQLTDLFVEEIHMLTFDQNTKNDEGKCKAEHQLSGVFFLLETHSEHLLLRLQRRLAETSIGQHMWEGDAPEQYLSLPNLSIYFIDRLESYSIAEKIGIDKHGVFKQVPIGFRDFFSDDLREAAMLARLRLKARS